MTLEETVAGLRQWSERRPFDEAPDHPGWYAVWLDEDGARQLSAASGQRVPDGIVYAGECRTQTIRRHLAHSNIGSYTLLKNLAALLIDDWHLHATNRGMQLDEAGRHRLLAWRDEHLTCTWTVASAEADFAQVLARLDPAIRLQGWGADSTPLRSAIKAGRSRLDAGA